jgi:hypothetical protein
VIGTDRRPRPRVDPRDDGRVGDTPSRVWTNPNSRSPCAAWLRFMKSMSMVDHGRASWSWVCRCSSGLRSASSPVIHIFAGEKVCIHAITPTHAASALASCSTRRMAADSVSTGLPTISAGSPPEAASSCWMRRDWPATCSRVSSP